MARSRDDAASEIETASVDGARDMSTSFAREGSVDFDGREGSGGLDSRRPDRDPSPFQAMRCDARGGFAFGSSRRYGTSSPSPAAGGIAARGGDTEERGRLWKKTDFPTDDALRKCRVYRHEDLPRHIYLLLDILGLQFRWVLTRFGRGRSLVSEAEQLVDDHKEHAWMALYANDRDVLETLLYSRLQTLWHDCTDALAVFTKHSAGTELCGQKAVILATLQSSKTKALTKDYSMILDNLEDDKDLTFEMIHRACVLQLRKRHDRRDDRHPERRPATPHRGSSSGSSKDKPPRNLFPRASRVLVMPVMYLHS